MINIRPATPQDIPVLVDFQLRLGAETENVVLNPQVLEKGTRAMFDDPRKGLYYVAVSDNEIVGCHMITYEWSDWRNGVVWWLQSVYVKESFRKSGVFRLMYENLVRMINADPAVCGLRLYADKTNERAHAVYKTMGMNGDHYIVFEWMKP